MTLNQFFTDFYRPLRLRGRSQNTSRLYGCTIRCFGKFLGREPQLADIADEMTLAVKLWVLPMDGESITVPQLRLCRIGGVTLGGNTVTPIRPDTSKTVPSALRVVSGSFQPVISGEWQADYYQTHGLAYQSAGAALQAWNKAQIDAGTFSRATLTQNFRAIGESPGSIRVGTMDDDLLFSAEPGSGIIIKPGDGLGLVAGTSVNTGGTQAVGNTSTFINYDIEAVLLHYPPTVSGTYPPVGDVDQGVLYGPNGNDYDHGIASLHM